MSFGRIGLGFAAVALLYVLWGAAERRLRRSPATLKDALPAQLTEALLLTLFAGLWFGSLGSGGALILFPIVGLLIELPLRLREASFRTLPWGAVASGVARVAVAGVVLQQAVGR